jgi:hypothetical protein
MCYSAQTSLNTWIINLISSVGLYILSDKTEYSTDIKIVSVIFTFVGFMQLYDYIFWTQQQNYINKLTTKIAMISNHLQPIVLFLVILYFKGDVDSISKILVLIYSIVISIYSVEIWDKLTFTGVTEQSKPSLYWVWNHGNYSQMVYTIFLITILTVLFNNLNEPLSYITSAGGLLMFLFTFFKYKSQMAGGRFWCYFTSLFPLFLYVFVYI